jgi:beta-lactamase superfamily II metal-dependent hydrolase
MMSSGCSHFLSHSKQSPRWLRFSAITILAVLAFSSISAAAPPADPAKSLRVYFVDVEGGQATLFVTPAGESLLIDTGWPGNHGRDADRIAAAAKDAGISKIDYVLITHFHDDHVGGVPQLAAKIPIGTLVDHGENRETGDKVTQERWLAYKALLDSGKYKHIVPKPGDKLPIKGIDVEVLTADGAVLDKPLPGSGKDNPACKDFNPPADNTENPRSLGTLITFGKLRILDLGDLTANKEKELMCPNNRIGQVDIYIASHHGLFQSNTAALVHAVAPHVAIVDNGETKGGSPAALDIIKSSPGIAGMWQLHYSKEGGEAHNTADEFIANLQGPDAGNYLKLTAQTDGSFSILNSRTDKAKTYSASH